MENNEEKTQGDLPQVPPAKPPDQSATQLTESVSESSVSEVHVQAMSEDMSEDETPTKSVPETQPETNNGVSLPIESASCPGGDHVGTTNGGPGVISQDHMGATNRGSEENAPSPAPNPGTGKTLKPRNPDKQDAKVTKKHFDGRMNELINATRELAQDQHTDNLKIVAGVGITTQIGQDMMQFMADFDEKTTCNLKSFEEKVRVSLKVLNEKVALIEGRLCATENSANDALASTTDVKTSLNGLTEALTKSNRQLAVHTRAWERLEGFLRENQSPRIRHDSKRVKRTRDQSPEVVNLERESNTQTTPRGSQTPMERDTTQEVGGNNTTRSNTAPPGTVLRNGSLATTIMGPNGTPILRMPGSTQPASRAAPLGTAPHGTLRNPRNGNQTATNTANGGNPILRLPRPTGQVPNQNGNRNDTTRPNQNSYASAATTSATTVPGLNLESQRGHHSQNNRGANQDQPDKSNGTDKQPTKVRQDQYAICPDTGHVKKVEAYKTVTYKSDKQKGRESKQHQKNLEQVLKELILFGIPIRNNNGDIMSKEQDRARITKFLRELRRYGYVFKNGDVVGSVRQWKNTRHPDHIPITITFRDEDTRFRVEEAALEGGLKGHRTPREGDEEYDRIGFIRRSLSERERKELKIRRDKRNSPEGMAFAEIKKREDNSRTDQDDWTNYDVEGNQDPIIDIPVNGYEAPVENQFRENNNNQIRGEASAEENLLKKLEELQKEVNRMRAEKEQTAAETNSAAGAENGRRNRKVDAARRAEETENESDWDLHDPIASEIISFRGNNGQVRVSPSNAATNFFATEPVFEYTSNLNLERPNLSKPEEGQTQTNTPSQRGGESSDSECDYE